MPKKEFKNPFESVKNLFSKNKEVAADGGEAVIAEKRKITGEDVKKFAGKAWSGYSFIFIFVAVLIVWLIITSGATTWNGVMNILRHSSAIGLIAIGMGLVIITGGIDLSVGSMLVLTAVMSIEVFNSTNSIFATFVVAVLFGTGLGLFNGLLIGKAKMPAFIVTLATMLAFRSIAQFFVNDGASNVNGSISALNRELSNYQNFFDFGNGFVATIPITGILLIVVTIVFVFVANRTKYGRQVYAIGSNEKAAFLAGVNVDWIRVSVYAFTGTLVGFAAFLTLSMSGNVDAAATAKNYEMYAIAAVVIGGISMAGGKGKIIGVLFGAMSYTVIDKIIVALGLGGLINDAIKGVILLAAVFLQVVGPMLRGVKLTDQIKEITGKWLAFGKTKKQLAAEAEGGESVTLDASEDEAVTEAEEAAERAVEDVLDGAESPEAAAEEIKAEEAVSEEEDKSEG